MAIPKNHDSEFDVPELYRVAASSRGIFVNTAFVELFGLTAIESSATGLPFVVTKNGGPQDIVENCQSGIIVDVNHQAELTEAMIKLLTDQKTWEQASNSGVNRVRKYYSWQAHCERYLEVLKDVMRAPTRTPSVTGKTAPGRRLGSLDSLLITDIDKTLLGDDEALARLKEIIHEHRDRMGFGVASGRALELINQALAEHEIDEIDVVIASVGSEIYYGRERIADKGWASQLRGKWRPDRVRAALDTLPYLQLQTEKHTQREFKISYNLDQGVDTDTALSEVHEALAQARTGYSLIFSHGTFLDILPHRASKGKAVRYLSGKWNVPLERVATAGDSGNDRDMLVGQTAGIVVGNHDEDLLSLKRSKAARIYFAEGHCAAGIIEGLEYYGLIDASQMAMT
jgi:sucrose-phosphate synthase